MIPYCLRLPSALVNNVNNLSPDSQKSMYILADTMFDNMLKITSDLLARDEIQAEFNALRDIAKRDMSGLYARYNAGESWKDIAKELEGNNFA